MDLNNCLMFSVMIFGHKSEYLFYYLLWLSIKEDMSSSELSDSCKYSVLRGKQFDESPNKIFVSEQAAVIDANFAI